MAMKWNRLAGRCYAQADGKVVTIDRKGRAKRTLPSGVRDPEPFAWDIRQRVRQELRQRLMSTTPLTSANVDLAPQKLALIGTFNLARTEWRQAGVALTEALGGNDGAALATIVEAVGSDDLELDDFLEEESGEDGERDDPRLEILIDKLNEASKSLARAIDDLAEEAKWRSSKS